MDEEQEYVEPDYGEYADIKRDQMIDRELDAKSEAWKQLQSLEWKAIVGGSYHSAAEFTYNDRLYRLSVGTGEFYGGSPVEPPDEPKCQSMFEVAVLDFWCEPDENEWVTSLFFDARNSDVVRVSNKRLLEFLEHHKIKPIKVRP